MVRDGDSPLDALREKTLEGVEEVAEEGKPPLVNIRSLLAHPEIDATEPAILDAIERLEEDGYIERMDIGPTFYVWPAGKGDDRLKELWLTCLEIIERETEEESKPVVNTRSIMDHPDVDVSKPTVTDRLDDLVDWGYVGRMRAGTAFVLWPAAKYDDMAARVEKLEADGQYHRRNASNLKEELAEVREELVEARREKEAARDAAVEKKKEETALSADQFLAPPLPTKLPEELELRWRIRAKVWRNNLIISGILSAVIVLLILAVYFARGALAGLPFQNAATVTIGLIATVQIAFLIAFVIFTVLEGVAISALHFPRIAPTLDKIALFFERLLGDVPGGSGSEGTVQKEGVAEGEGESER